MHLVRTRSLLVFAVAAAAAAGIAAPVAIGAQRAALSPADADRFDRKYQELIRYGGTLESSRFRSAIARRTTFTEAETNAYLQYKAGPDIPKGMIGPSITATGGGRIVGAAVLDLDVVRRDSQRGMFDLAQLLTGKYPVAVSGVLRTRKGIATFELESASIGGVPVPRSLIALVLAYYSRSPQHPRGLSLDAQYILPWGIQEIDIQSHRAVVTQ